ncbi:MAG: methyltransferase [Candidatus Promineifilaceae bacterium]|nr:methyltransferase [Candidatus Promineifilaceae bacterium]
MSAQESRPPPPTLIFDITSAVHPAFAFLAGTQLDVFTPLGAGPLTAEQIADSLNLDGSKLAPLLYALAAYGFLTVDDGRFANSELASHYLVRGSPRYMGQMHRLLSQMWEAELSTAATIRTGVPQAKHDYSSLPKEELEHTLRGLHPGAIAAAYALMKRFDFAAHNSLIDVGGGSGGVAITIAESYPQLEATILDLPTVTPIARQFVDRSQARDRIHLVAQDIVQHPIKGSFDVAILRAFIHVLGPAEIRQALRHVGNALKPGGQIYISGPVMDDSRTSPPETAAFNLVFLNVYDHGQAYTEGEHREWLEEAGFTEVERTLLPDGNSFISARKQR